MSGTKAAICNIAGHPSTKDDDIVMTMLECERYVRRTEKAGGTGQWYLQVRADHDTQLSEPEVVTNAGPPQVIWVGDPPGGGGGGTWTAPLAPPLPVEKKEMVDHPEHYNSHPAGIECIDVIEPMTFNIGSSIKYLWRQGLKPDVDAKEDLEKALWYIKREIERLYPEDK